jgi:uncharacterized protein (TIGR03437 family)
MNPVTNPSEPEHHEIPTRQNPLLTRPAVSRGFRRHDAVYHRSPSVQGRFSKTDFRVQTEYFSRLNQRCGLHDPCGRQKIQAPERVLIAENAPRRIGRRAFPDGQFRTWGYGVQIDVFHRAGLCQGCCSFLDVRPCQPVLWSDSRLGTMTRLTFIITCLFTGFSPAFTGISAAAPDRVTRPVSRDQLRIVRGNVHPLARAPFDRGTVDPSLPLDHVMLLFRPSAAQQSDLDQLLLSQQNPSSPGFHKWLTPEQFADRFGISTSDHSKVVAWLQSEGLTVNESGRGRNWVAFSGTAAQVSRALGTEIHRYQANGATHIANATEPSVPEALADIVGGFMGLNDFHPKSMATGFRPLPPAPDYNNGGSHYLVPQDFATIYDISPLYTAGFDGTGQAIAIVGQSDLILSDLSAFRARYGLSANPPVLVPYGADPGVNNDLIEADLDLEWAGAIAPKARIYYVYGPDAFVAAIVAVGNNIAPVISISYGGCEIDNPVGLFRAIGQQANAQGITILSASGDSGAAGCDSQGADPSATRGESVNFPADLPEVTGVGGTFLNEAGGNFWAPANSANLGSALTYIPEIAWNESSQTLGLAAGGGGVSVQVAKPAWQAGPGVPNDNARDVPDVAFSAALHDGYYITYLGSNGYVGGTSASAPSFAGIVAILNQYQVAKGFQPAAGLGNINPQLYRLAQSAPTAFHDVTVGSNIVPCQQGSPNCVFGTFGYAAGNGYDAVTGLGSVDANNLVTQWNTAASAVNVSLTLSPARATVNDTLQLTATVVAASGTGVPTGTVNFQTGGVALATATLVPVAGVPTASATFQASQLGTGNGSIYAIYSGDAAFSSGTGSAPLRIVLPPGAAAIEASASLNPVYASPPDAQGPSWQTTITLAEVAGVPAMITGFTIDGQAQPMAQYFPSTAIPANGRITATIVLRNLAVPLTSIFGFSGTDAAGNAWARQIQVNFLGPQVFQNFNLSATPLTMMQNPSAACQWSQLLTLDETGGYAYQVTGLLAGNVDISNQIPAIFGTNRLAAYGSLQGTLCWNGIKLPASNNVLIELTDEFGNLLESELTVSFAGPPANPVALSATPPLLSIQQVAPGVAVQATLVLGITDKTQSWTASVSPGNRTTSWLTLSQYSGTGPANITLTALANGFEAGVYRANIVFQSPNAVPQYITVPVMFIYGASGGSAISGVTNAESYQVAASPGMIMAVFGTQLATAPQSASALPLPLSMSGVAVTINGLPAPLYYISPTQLNVQVPYEAGAGPAVLGVNNQGQISGIQFQISPSAPGIVTDGNGNVNPTPMAQAGSIGVLYVTGDGVVTPALRDGFSPASGTPLPNLPHSLLPFSVTVGGIPAFLEFVGITPGVVGLTQVNFMVPGSVQAGMQPVVVIVNGVPSPPVNITVQASQ